MGELGPERQYGTGPMPFNHAVQPWESQDLQEYIPGQEAFLVFLCTRRDAEPHSKVKNKTIRDTIFHHSEWPR